MKISRLDFISIVIIGLGTIAVIYLIATPRLSSSPARPYSENKSQQPTVIDEGTGKPTEQNQPIKDSVALTVPFTPQAPTANWDELHNEACEEASIIMANSFVAGDRSETLTAAYVEKEITKLTDWQKKNQGYYLDQTSAEVAKMATAVYGLRIKTINKFTEQDLKQALSENKLVVISFNGRLLENPNYKPPGPIHHMMVITGYDENGFITNDPGTRRGRNYRYSYAILSQAAAEWNHSMKETDPSKKPALIISKS